MKYIILMLLILILGSCAVAAITAAAYLQGYNDGQQRLVFKLNTAALEELNETVARMLAEIDYLITRDRGL